MGGSVEEPQFQELLAWLNTKKIGPISTQAMPLQWMSDGPYYHGDVHVASIYHNERRDDLILINGRLSALRPLSPPFLGDSAHSWEHSWVLDIAGDNPRYENDLSIRLPRARCMDEFLRYHGPLAFRDSIHFSRRGFALIENAPNDALHIYPIQTFDVLRRLIGDATGLTVNESVPGRYAMQIIKKLGDPMFGRRVLKLRGIRDILRRLNEDGKCFTRGNMHDIYRSTSPDKYGINWDPELYRLFWLRKDVNAKNFSGVLDVLLEKQIIRPGFKLTCENCAGACWYHVTEFGETFTCRFCFEQQRLRFGAVKDWQYASDGLFRLPRLAEGSISVVLAISRFASLFYTGDDRYSRGLELKGQDGRVQGEIDFVWLNYDFREPFGYQLVLGEAKSFEDLNHDQVGKLAELASKLDCRPFLSFVTQKDRFGDDEKALL